MPAEQSLVLAAQLDSRDGSCKYLWRLHDGNTIESVFLRFPNHDSLCISSQVGCSLKCAFCATGLDGLTRNLTHLEIVGQVEKVFGLRGHTIRNFEVSFMGMGEPLLNLEAVLEAIRRLQSCYPALIFSLSTVGLVPQIYKLAESRQDVQLQISLHAPNDELRSQIVPLNSRYPIREVLGAAKYYAEYTQNALYINYILLSGINDSDACAIALGQLLRGMPAYVKISKFNPSQEILIQRSSRQRDFEELCRNEGLDVYRFSSMAEDVNGGCGQLRSRVVDPGSSSIAAPNANFRKD